MDSRLISRSFRRLGAIACMVASAGLLIGAGTARANITSADFEESLNFYPTACSNARVLQALGRAVGPGVELGEADEIANPCGYGDSFLVDVDPVTNRVTLTPSGSNNYQVIDIQITNINTGGQAITGLTPISDNIIDVASSAPFTRTLGSTANSLSIHYDVVTKSFPGAGRLEFSTGSAVFQIQFGGAPTTTDVPTLSPALLALLALLVAGAGFVVVKRRGRG